VLAGDALFAAAFAEMRLERSELGAQIAKPGVRAARSRRPCTARGYASCCWRSANHFLM
jgi:hypothetical protein